MSVASAGTMHADAADMGRQRFNLLLVDDEQRSAHILARMLREDGYDVDVAADAHAAIVRLDRPSLPDVLITDLRMLPVDGLAVARYARSLDPAMPLLFVTGDPQLVSRRCDLVPEPVVHVKPIDYATLARQVGELSRRRLPDE